jgi:hypothetical protein
MHEKLVKNAKDFVGMIAYSIYKSEKREAIRNGVDIASFIKLKSQPNEIKKYKAEAEDLANIFLQSAADFRLKSVQTQLAEQINKLTLNNLPKEPAYKGILRWHTSGAAGVIGNFWTAVIVAIFVWMFADQASWDKAKSNAVDAATATITKIQSPSPSGSTVLPAGH